MPAPTKVARHTLFNFLTIALTSAMGVGVTALVARVLSPEGMGHYTLLTWLIGIAGMFANLGYVTAAMKYMAESLGRDNPEEAAGVLAFSSRQVLLFGFGVSALLILASPLTGRRFDEPDMGLALMAGAVAVIPTALVALYTAACQALQRYDQVALVTGVTATCTLGGTVLSIVNGWGMVGLLAATGFSAGLGALGYMLLLTRWRPDWYRAALSDELKRAMRTYQGPVFVMLMLDAIVWQRSEVFFLGAYSPAKEVAYYGMAFTLANMAMKLLPGTLIGLLIPNLSRSVGAGDQEGVRRIFLLSCRYMAMLALPVAIGGALVAPALVQVLYGPGYEPVAGLLGVLLGANALVMIYGFPASSVLYATNGQNRLVRIGLWISVVNVGLAWLLIPRFGAWGAVGSCALAQLSSLLPGLRAVRDQTGAKAPVGMVLQILTAALVMGVPVYAVTRWTPPLVALFAGPLVGVVAFFLTLFAAGMLTAEDRALVGPLLARLKLSRRTSSLEAD
ncbi:MAG TPA: flippase [Stenomitos sp.]